MRKFAALFGFGVLAALAAPSGRAVADDDLVAAGKAVFDARCKVCHTAEAGAKHKIGPNLFGVIGKPAGWQESFRYSKGHRECRATWDGATMDRYLEDVTMVAPGTVKRFGGLSKPEERAAIIAYLHTLK